MKEGGTLVPRSLFLNRTETFATQALNYAVLFFFFFFFFFHFRNGVSTLPAGVTQTPQYKGVIGTSWLFIVCIRNFKNKKKTWPT